MKRKDYRDLSPEAQSAIVDAFVDGTATVTPDVYLEIQGWSSLSAYDITEEDIEAVEDELGMGRGAWDMVDHAELLAAAYCVMHKRLNHKTKGEDMKTLSAAEARKRADESLKNGPEIRAFIEILDRRIGELADAGHNKMEPWLYLSTRRLMHPRPEQREAIKQHYIDEGFGWEEYPDPDPGNPASSAYTHITW